MIQRYPWFLDFALQVIIEGNKQIVKPIRAWRNRHGLEGRDPYFLRLALAADPEPLTVHHILLREPYAATVMFEGMLQETAVRGFLTPGYYLTDKGRALVTELPHIYQITSKAVVPINNADSQRLIALLQRLVESSLASSLPHPILDNLCRFPAPADAPLFLQIRDAVMALWGFRDDAHLASWQKLPVSPIGWEAFTFVWQGEAKTAVSLAQKLTASRGHDATAYATALQELVQLGWLELLDDAYSLTQAGTTVREQAEQETDDTFYHPWQTLTPTEIDELQHHLAAFCQGLAAPIP